MGRPTVHNSLVTNDEWPMTLRRMIDQDAAAGFRVSLSICRPEFAAADKNLDQIGDMEQVALGEDPVCDAVVAE